MQSKTMHKPEIRHAFPECVRIESKPHLFCPGCGHPEVLKSLGFAIDELGLQQSIAFGVDIGCSLLAWDYFNIDTIETHHGRTIPTMAGLSRARRDAHCIAYVGDGGAYAIGGGHLLNAAVRDENIMVIVVNNAVYAMTGGQEAPTTLPGMIVDTAPCGADQYYVRGPDMVRNVNPTAFVARGITSRQLELRTLLKDALKFLISGNGFVFVEVLSPCTLNWGTMDNAAKTYTFLEENMARAYPVKRY